MNPVSATRKEYLLDEMSRFVSSRSGVIQSTLFFSDQTNFIECPKARSSHGTKSIGAGVDIDMPTAMIKSLAEALERYALIYAKANGVFLYNKSMKDLQNLGYDCFYSDYDVFEGFVYKNYPYLKQMNPDLKTDWTACHRFSDNKLVWLPATYIYGYQKNKNQFTNPLKKLTTNGMACSFLDSAIEDSILELIERDTFLYMWFAKKPGKEILLDELRHESLKKLLSLIGYNRMKQIKLIYKYTDTQIPCVFVIFKGQKKYDESAFYITGSADTHIERGCYRALLEFVSIYNSSLYIKKPMEKMRSRKNVVIKNFEERAVYYAMYENFNKCEFLFDVAGTKKLSELSNKWNIDNKKEIMKKHLKGKSIFFKDVTPKEFEKTSFCIVRSYSPDLMDLDCEESQPFNFAFKKKRVDMVDRFLNTRTHSLNKVPHCYP